MNDVGGDQQGRTVTLLGATGVGVGAIVGGGILVLAGVAFQATGPSSLVAFALNGVVAVLTALSFAEMSTAFPESGGAYTFAKKVLTVRAAFAVGWVLWFAYIVAGVLYALGFAEYAVAVLADVWRALGGTPPEWLRERAALVALALVATAAYTISMIRKGGGGGQWDTPETLMTVAEEPWAEIARVARARQCESLLLGMATLDDPKAVARLEELLNDVDCDVAVLRAPSGWSLGSGTRIVVPVGGRGGHDDLRARLLGSLGRTGRREVRFVRILPGNTPDERREQVRRELFVFAEEETHGHPGAEVIASDDVVGALAGSAGEGDLLVLGLQRHRGKRLFGEVALQVARRTDAATILISRKG